MNHELPDRDAWRATLDALSTTPGVQVARCALTAGQDLDAAPPELAEQARRHPDVRRHHLEIGAIVLAWSHVDGGGAEATLFAPDAWWSGQDHFLESALDGDEVTRAQAFADAYVMYASERTVVLHRPGAGELFYVFDDEEPTRLTLTFAGFIEAMRVCRGSQRWPTLFAPSLVGAVDAAHWTRAAHLFPEIAARYPEQLAQAGATL